MEKVHKPTGWKSLQMNVNDFWIFTVSTWLFLWCVVCDGVSFVVVFGFPSPHHPLLPRPHNSVCQRSIWKGTCHYLLHSIGFFTKNKCHRNMPFLWTLLLSTSCCFPIKSGGFFSKSFCMPSQCEMHHLLHQSLPLVSKINCSHSKDCVKDESQNYLFFILHFIIPIFTLYQLLHFFEYASTQTSV